MKIYLIHRHHYWTEYLDFLLEDSDRFGLVASVHALEPKYKGEPLELFDPDRHRMLVIAGLLDDKTKGNQIIFRSLHSPGFYVFPHLIGYFGLCKYHPDCDFRMLLIENQYRRVITHEIDHPLVSQMQYDFMLDPRVGQMKADLSLYRFVETKPTVQREAGTALVCMSWMVMYTPLEELEKMIESLRKHVKVSLVLHPVISSASYVEAVKAMEGRILEKVYYSIPRNEMLELYDKHDFIVTDGSGACYEAMMRGCKPLAVRDYYRNNKNDMAMSMYYDRLDDEFFPFQNYEELGDYRPFPIDSFLHKMFPFLYEYTSAEAKAIAKDEILRAGEQLREVSKG